MFDLGFSELIVIAIVLLVVVGPERLPGVARTAGHLFGRMQRYISDVKADIRREMQFDELKKLQQQTRELEQSLREGMGEIQSDVREALSLPESETSSAMPSQDADMAESVGMDTQGSAQALQFGSEQGAPVLSAPVPDTSMKPVDSV
jgi:sec-independent protein translocase protein TatB